jgi:hypothetical protein
MSYLITRDVATYLRQLYDYISVRMLVRAAALLPDYVLHYLLILRFCCIGLVISHMPQTYADVR